MDPYSIGVMLGHKPSTGDAYYTHYTIADVERGLVSPFSMISIENDNEKIIDGLHSLCVLICVTCISTTL